MRIAYAVTAFLSLFTAIALTLYLLSGLARMVRDRLGDRFLLPAAVTRVGWGAALLALLIGAAAVNTGTNLLYLMLSTLFALFLVSVLMGRGNLSRIAVSVRPPRTIHAGEEVDLLVEISNRSRLASSFGVSLIQRVVSSRRPPPGGQDALTGTFIASLSPKEKIEVVLPVRFPERGEAELRPLTLLSVFPFGMIERRARRGVSQRVLVYPRRVEIGEGRRFSAAGAGTVDTGGRGHGLGLYSIRNYTPGDPARSIHWKLSAKGLGLMIREQEREENPRYRICIQPSLPAEPGAGDLERFERALGIGATLTRRLAESGFEVGLWTPAGMVRFGDGPRHMHAILRLLALAEPGDYVGTRPPPPLRDGIDLNITGTESAARDGIADARDPDARMPR